MRSSSVIIRAAALAGVMGILPASAQQAAPAAPAAPPAAAAPSPAAVLAPAADAKVIVVGSVVQLRSGGPKLTVTELTTANTTAVWFLEGNGYKKETFPTASLKLADADDDEDEDEDEDEDDDE